MQGRHQRSRRSKCPHDPAREFAWRAPFHSKAFDQHNTELRAPKFQVFRTYTILLIASACSRQSVASNFCRKCGLLYPDSHEPLYLHDRPRDVQSELRVSLWHHFTSIGNARHEVKVNLVEQLSSPSKRTDLGAKNGDIVCKPGTIEPTLYGRMDKRMKAIYGIYGASGFGREVIPILQEQVTKNNEPGNSIVFIDDNSEHERSNSYPVISFESFLESPADQHHVSIAISNSKIRQQIEQKCIAHDVNLLSLRAQNAIILDEVRIGRGSIICPFTTLTSNIKIGKQFQANIYSYVAHDCVIGDYVTFAPSVKCNGNVVIDDHAYIGTGAIIKQGQPDKPIRIGKGAIVAAGSFVNKDVPDGMTVFGSPAIELTKENLRKRNG